jgi:hypothetical protein
MFFICLFVIVTLKSEFIAYNLRNQLDEDSGSSTLSLSRTSSDDSLKLRLQNNKQVEAATAVYPDSRSIKLNRSVSSRLKSKLFNRNTKLMSSFRPGSVVQVSNINNSSNNKKDDYLNRHNNFSRSAKLKFIIANFINIII